MTPMKYLSLTILVAACSTLPGAAHAQVGTAGTGSIVACPSQGELEQSLGSQGSITPEECTTLQVNSLSSDNGELCLIDFGLDQGFLGRLRDAAFPTQWWVACSDLEASLQ